MRMIGLTNLLGQRSIKVSGGRTGRYGSRGVSIVYNNSKLSSIIRSASITKFSSFPFKSDNNVREREYDIGYNIDESKPLRLFDFITPIRKLSIYSIKRKEKLKRRMLSGMRGAELFLPLKELSSSMISISTYIYIVTNANHLYSHPADIGKSFRIKSKIRYIHKSRLNDMFKENNEDDKKERNKYFYHFWKGKILW